MNRQQELAHIKARLHSLDFQRPESRPEKWPRKFILPFNGRSRPIPCYVLAEFLLTLPADAEIQWTGMDNYRDGIGFRICSAVFPKMDDLQHMDQEPVAPIMKYTDLPDGNRVVEIVGLEIEKGN